MSDQRLSSARLIGFSLGSVGTGLFSTTPTVLLLFYLTQIIGVSGTLAGIALLAPKLWDMVTDPLVGMWSDRTKTRFGRRRPFLVAGAVLMPMGLLAMFSVPEAFSPELAFWYVVGLYVFSATAYSLFSVPYITVPAELSRDADERTRIMSFRTAFVMLGVLVGSALPPYLVTAFGGDRAAYALTGVVLAILCFIAMATAIVSLTGVRLIDSDTAHTTLKDAAKAVGSASFVWLSATHVLQIIAVGTVLAAATYLAVFVFGSQAALAGDFLFATFATAMLAMPAWWFCATRFGRLRAFLAGAVLYAIAALTLTIFGTSQGVMLFIGAGVGMGIAFAAIQMIPYALLTDTIHAYGERHGFGREGVFTGIWTALEKLGLAIAPFLFGVGLDIIGFIEGDENAVQPDGVESGLLFLGAGIPALFVFASLLGLWGYDKAMRRQMGSR